MKKTFVKKLLVVTAIAAVLLVVSGFELHRREIKESEPYALAVARARADARVRDALGGDFTEPFLPSGSISEAGWLSGQGGAFELKATIEGPRGTGWLRATASQLLSSEGPQRWHLDTLVVETFDGKTIRLIEDHKR